MKKTLNATVIEAIEQRRIMYWHADGFRRTVEPHMYATISGNRQVLICYRIDSGGSSDRSQFWNVVDDRLDIEIGKEKFSSARDIPAAYIELVQTVHAKV